MYYDDDACHLGGLQESNEHNKTLSTIIAN